MNTNIKEVSLVLSLKKNGIMKTLNYIFSYILIKFKIRDFIFYKKNKMYLRPNSTDFPTFREIFFGMEYDLKYPPNIKNIIDAGANIGAATVYFAECFPNAKIFAIEPDKENFLLLCKNTRDLKNVTPINKGLWSAKQYLKLTNREIAGASGVSTSLANNVDEDSIEGISLSELLNSYNIEYIDILKIDIEGAETEVFSEGCNKWLSKVDTLIVETHDRLKKGCSKSLFSALNNFDYSTEISGEKFLITINQNN